MLSFWVAGVGPFSPLATAALLSLPSMTVGTALSDP